MLWFWFYKKFQRLEKKLYSKLGSSFIVHIDLIYRLDLPELFLRLSRGWLCTNNAKVFTGQV